MIKNYLKITSYLLSLLPLSLIFFVKAYEQVFNLKTNDLLFRFFIIGSGIYLLFIAIGIGIWYAKKRGTKFPVTITNVRNNNNEQILYLMTYIIPLISIDYDRSTFIQLIVALILIGLMYCKTNLFFANPFLSLLGRNIYRAHIENSQINVDAIIMTKKSIREVSSQQLTGLYIIDEEVILII